MAVRSVKRVAWACFWDRPSKTPRAVKRTSRRKLTGSRFVVDSIPIRVGMWIGGGDEKRFRWWVLMRWDYLLRQGRRNGRIYRFVTVTEKVAS